LKSFALLLVQLDRDSSASFFRRVVDLAVVGRVVGEEPVIYDRPREWGLVPKAMPLKLPRKVCVMYLEL
jgi:hypothetical protein